MSRRVLGRAAQAAIGVVACTALLSACSGASGSHPGIAGTASPAGAAAVTSTLGAVPIPTAPTAGPTPVARLGHPQLLAMGQPVKVVLPGASATVTALGPYELTPYTGGPSLPQSTPGLISLSVQVTSGMIRLRAADMLSRDETGRIVSLRPAGAATVTASPGRPARLRVRGTFRSGAAQLTWRYHGHVVAVWDFNVELD